MKRKCDGKQPCARCERRSRDCLYSYKQKSGPPKGSKRKLIEEEDDLPENRGPIKPTLVRHVENLGAAASPAAWPGRGSGDNGHGNGGEAADGRVTGGDFGNHIAPSSSALVDSAAQQFNQVPAQQYSQAPTQQPTPAPAQLSVPVSTQGFGQVPSVSVGPSPEARAAAAAAVAASRMNALAPVPPPLTAAGLRPSYMLQHPPALPGLPGGSGVAGGGVPAAAPMVAHQQYGSVYQHHYPPEVYAVYLAELRQRSTGCSSTPNGTISTSNYNNPTTSVAAATGAAAVASSTPPQPAMGHSWEARPSPAAPAEAAHNESHAENGSTSGEASEAAHSSQPSAGMSGAPLLPGIGSGWPGGGGGGTGTSSVRGADSGGSSGGGGGVEPDTVALARVAKMPQGGSQSGDGGVYSGKASVAAASSEALAEAVAVAIAESSPEDGDTATENANALTYSAALPLNGDRKTGGSSSSGGGGSGGGGDGGVPDSKPPLSPVKFNHSDFMVPRGHADAAGTTTAAPPKAVVSPEATAAATQAAPSGSAPPAVAVSPVQREKTDLAAAGLLLYGARGQGGGIITAAGVDNAKIREGQENFQS
eukprot:g10232.t1